jgi:hypothetical protein
MEPICVLPEDDYAEAYGAACDAAFRIMNEGAGCFEPDDGPRHASKEAR